MIEVLGAKAISGAGNVGQFGRFVWQAMGVSARRCVRPGTYPRLWTQLLVIGVRSVPIVMKPERSWG